MAEPGWAAVDRYLASKFVPKDPALEACLEASAAAGLPNIQVSPLQGRLLHLIARLSGARRILEVGTLGGYSAICLARALAPGGRMITLEIEPKHAEVARANLQRAGLGSVVEVRIGPALDSLPAIERERLEPFDLFFLDADRPNNRAYIGWAMRLSHPGSVIVVDNVVRHGEVADPTTTDPRVLGVREMIDAVAAEPRLTATAIQTVGRKGYDGFLLARVGEPSAGTDEARGTGLRQGGRARAR